MSSDTERQQSLRVWAIETSLGMAALNKKTNKLITTAEIISDAAKLLAYVNSAR